MTGVPADLGRKLPSTPVVRDAVPALPLPDPALLREAAGGEASPARHDALAARVPALRLVELGQPAGPPPAPPGCLRVAAWNLERCTRIEASAALLRRAGVGAALLSEMDLGMARSGQRHTARDLAGALLDGSDDGPGGGPRAGHVYGVEFVELGLGVGAELARFAGQSNSGALHGNAVVSALPLRDPFMVRLDAGGAWFGLDWHHRRLGGRVAVGATVDLARGPVLLVSLHLESSSTAAERAAAVERLLARLPPAVPAVVAGDLNTAALPDPASEPDLGWFERPGAREPLFGALAGAGFDWRRANAPDQTRRRIPDGRRAPRVQRIDWFFTRGLDAAEPRTWAATDADGAPLSDHELITVDVG